jgi:hypothetical protein
MKENCLKKTVKDEARYKNMTSDKIDNKVEIIKSSRKRNL